MRPISVEACKTKMYDFVIRLRQSRMGGVALHVTTEELEDLVKKAKTALKVDRG